jgi:hypothetical protein
MVRKEKESTLALFEARIFFVDDVDATLPTDDLAVGRAAFDGGANFHVLLWNFGCREPGRFRGGNPPGDTSRK